MKIEMNEGTMAVAMTLIAALCVCFVVAMFTTCEMRAIDEGVGSYRVDMYHNRLEQRRAKHKDATP